MNLRAQRGMTILELMIALAVIGMMALVGYMGVRKVRKSDLREDTNKVAAALRNAYNLAASTGVHHRVVLKLDEQTVAVEACEGKSRLRKAERDSLTDPQELTPKAAVDGRIPEEMQAVLTPEATVELAGAISGTRVGLAKCSAPKRPDDSDDPRGAIIKLQSELGIRVRRVFVQHLDDPQLDGVVTVNFFPLGFAEKALIELANDDGDQYTLLVHGLTGRVEFRDHDLADANEHMMRDGAGDRSEAR